MIVEPGPLPPDPRRWPCMHRIAGRDPQRGSWPHDEDPNVVPWTATHRILWRDKHGRAGRSDVMFVRRNDGSCTWDGHPIDQVFYGFEREQWHPNGRTGWAYFMDRGYPHGGGPFNIHRTDPLDRRDLILIKLGPDGEPVDPRCMEDPRCVGR